MKEITISDRITNWTNSKLLNVFSLTFVSFLFLNVECHLMLRCISRYLKVKRRVNYEDIFN